MSVPTTPEPSDHATAPDTAATAYATHVVTVPVTTVWVAPTSPRAVDAPVVAADADAVAWLAALDRHTGEDEAGDGRLGLHGRVETQLLQGEPVLVTGADASGHWVEVVAPWQPSPKDPRGYPGWVPAAHLRPLRDGETVAPPSPAPDVTADVVLPDHPHAGRPDAGHPDADHPAVALARRHLGLTYLWSGTSPLGYDCSGLVLHTWRRLGVVVARDAYAQAETATPVDLDDVRSGDLYFFARPGRRIHHVGIVVRPGRMVHASETGGVLVEEDLTPERLDTLVAAGRLPTS